MTLTLQDFSSRSELHGREGRHGKPQKMVHTKSDSKVAFQPCDLYEQQSISDQIHVKIKAAVELFQEEIKKKKMQGAT